jgi:hypothetical protein
MHIMHKNTPKGRPILAHHRSRFILQRSSFVLEGHWGTLMAIWIMGTIYFAHSLSNTATDSSPPLRQAQAPGQASPPPPPQDVAMKLQWQASKSKELIDMRDFPRPEKSRESEERLQSAESTTECHHPARHVGLHTPATKLRHGSNQCVQTETHGTLGARHIAATLFHAEKFDRRIHSFSFLIFSRQTTLDLQRSWQAILLGRGKQSQQNIATTQASFDKQLGYELHKT